MDLKTASSVTKILLLLNTFSLMSTGPAGSYGDVKLFQTPVAYNVDSTVLLNDVESRDKEVGYKIKSTLTVDPVWTDLHSHFILKFELQNPKLHVRSRSAPHEGFIEHASQLDNFKNSPFFAEWKNGIIKNVYIDVDKEDPSWVNYKKGIVSVFQFQILDQVTEEEDISGKCTISYESLSPTLIRKIKKNCNHPDIRTNPSNNVFSTLNKIVRLTSYEFTKDLKTLNHIYAEELHELRLGVKQDAGNKIRIWQELKLLSHKPTSNRIKSKYIKDGLSEIEAKYSFVLKPQSLLLNVPNEGQVDRKYDLAELIKDNHENLQAEKLGTEKSALAFINILKAMRAAKTQEIINVLKHPDNKDILQQLLDLVGYTQTLQAHKAAKSFLNFDNEYDKDNIERYLWALSIGPNPQENVVSDILKMTENAKLPEQINETLLLTASAMTDRFVLNGNHNTDSISAKIKDHISKNLSKCKESRCTITYLRALKNLKRNDTIPIILDYVKNGKKEVTVVAMQALRALPKKYWSKNVIKECKKVFYQIQRKYDSSARTLAIDILVENRPVLYEIEEMLDYLTSNDKEFEVKQFLWQRLQMLSEKCTKTKEDIGYMLKKHLYINNYNVMAQKGLSTALARKVSSNPWSNMTVESVQEISGGVLKRGRIDLVIDDAGQEKRVFSLDLFADGLSAMVGGDTSEEAAEDETATSGMELSVLGVHVRPFTFFNGQAELMGHVWSGTASERTPAFQSLMLVQEETTQSVAGVGLVIRSSIMAAASVDLAGQVQLSLWSRTAHCVVDQVAGVVIQGAYSANMPFVRSEVKFSLSVEPKLDLESDIDFYNGVKLCVQVKRPDTVFRHNVTKLEWIPENKHRMRKSKFAIMTLPGKTFALNRKNNIMCNEIHNKS